MASEQLKRSALRHFMNTTPQVGTGTATKTYHWINEGVSDLSVSMNPETETVQWIGQDSASTFLKSYGITMDTTQIAFKGDPVYDFVSMLAWKQAVLGASETDVVESWIFGEGEDTAKEWRVSISVNDYGGPGSDAPSISYTINIKSDPVFGTFDLDALTFTPSLGA